MSTAVASRTRAFAPLDIAHVAVFAALIAVLALTPPIPVGALGVPITLQTLGVSLAALCLGPWRGAAAVALYLVVGLAGLPVFSGGRAGIGVLLGPTGGYLIAFVLAAVVSGFVARWAVRQGIDKWTPVWLFGGVLVARYLVIWPIGTAGIARATGTPISEVWLADMAFWPGDLLKTLAAVVIALAVHKAFPRLLGR